MKINKFFHKTNSINLSKIFKILNLKFNLKDIKINDIKDLHNASSKDLSFMNSIKYLDLLKKTKSKYIVTNLKYKKLVSKYGKPIIVSNVLKSVADITLLFYPYSLDDTFDINASYPNIKKFKNVKFGKHVLLGKNVKIGKNTIIGHNTIIESNVKIGSNCQIGNNVILKFTEIGENVKILDGAVIGKKGFGFFPNDKYNQRYPHIGMVLIGNNSEIGCNSTIDRGSLSNTIIGKNTFIDNQVHIAHNVKIGSNCIITAQVGFAGSSVVGSKVQIGGQAGISGHLKVGNNVQIGGGSGVIKNIPDNCKVMGYPAKDFRKFLKENK